MPKLTWQLAKSNNTKEHPWRQQTTVFILVTDHKRQNVPLIPALLDSGMTMSCVHLDIVRKFRWDVHPASQYMRGPVLNMDGSTNVHGSVIQECQLLVRYRQHSEWMHMVVLNVEN